MMWCRYVTNVALKIFKESSNGKDETRRGLIFG